MKVFQKNKLIILGHELKVTKKINDALYRKIQLLTYSRTTEQKLKDSYKTLKDIDNKLKSPDTPKTTKKIPDLKKLLYPLFLVVFKFHRIDNSLQNLFPILISFFIGNHYFL